MIKNKLLLFLFVLLLLVCFYLGLTNASLDLGTTNKQTVPLNTSVNISIPCFNNNSLCSSSAKCNLTLTDQSGNILLLNQLMNNHLLIQDYNYTFLDQGTYNAYFVCNDNSQLGSTNSVILVTPKGFDKPGDNTFLVYTLLFIALIFSLIFILLYSIGGMLSLRTDILDIALNIGAYFAILSYWFFESNYLGIKLINDLLTTILDIAIWTNLVLPMLGLIFTLTLGPYLKKKYPNVWGTMPGYKTPYSPTGA